MKIIAVQFDITWEKPEANRKWLEKYIPRPDPGDLVLLPEMWSTGFTMNPSRHAEPAEQGPCFEWMRNKAMEWKTPVAGSLAVSTSEGQFKNRFYTCFPDGSFGYYDKRHLFSLAGEHEHYSAGQQKWIFHFQGWNFLPLICYDLRFPVWCRNRVTADTGFPEYDIMLVVANWPASRSYPWKQLLIARAIENQCYLCAVNRVGKDVNGIDHSGDSMFISPFGDVLSVAKPGENDILYCTPDRELIHKCRSAFPFWKDADEFSL